MHPEPVRLLVPAYFPPGPEWDVLRTAAGAVGIVILNPASGPGEVCDEGYRALSSSLRAAGIQVVGYVDTAYGARDAQSVLAEVERHRRWYAVDGVFYDQVTIDCGHHVHQMELSAGARRQGCQLVVANSGVAACECLLLTADIIVSAENEAGAYLATPLTHDWERLHAASRFGHLVYGAVGIDRLHQVIAAARSRHAGWIFVTPLPRVPLRSGGAAEHPWAGLPGEPYWSALIAALSNRDG